MELGREGEDNCKVYSHGTRRMGDSFVELEQSVGV